MRLASWNINGINARLERLTNWLEHREPAVLAIQELKSTRRQLPLSRLEAAGYHVEAAEHVALISTAPFTEVSRLTGDGRTVAANTHGYRFVSVYAPNGRKARTPAHDAKLQWFTRLQDVVSADMAASALPYLMMGDFNVAREPRDVWDPISYRTRNLFTQSERDAMDKLVAVGLVDIFRRAHSGKGLYTWWNYAHDSFARNRGWRLDYMLVTPDIEDYASFAVVDVEERAAEATSDHAPIWLDLDLRAPDSLRRES